MIHKMSVNTLATFLNPLSDIGSYNPVFHAFFHEPLSTATPTAHPKITGFKNRVYTTSIARFQKSEVKKL
jgi:hypothetical protein